MYVQPYSDLNNDLDPPKTMCSSDSKIKKEEIEENEYKDLINTRPRPAKSRNSMIRNPIAKTEFAKKMSNPMRQKSEVSLFSLQLSMYKAEKKPPS